MQEFLVDYGLWLLIALLVVIMIIFLVSGRKRPTGALPPQEFHEALPAETPVRQIDERLPEPAVPKPPIDLAPSLPPSPRVAPVEPVELATPVDPVPPTPLDTAADDLLKLKGVGPKLAALLTELGVTRFAQIAAWTDTDLAAIDARLGAFKGRPVRDHWIDQAKYLATGDIFGFEAKYGKL